MDYTNRPGDAADPWHTGDFETAWRGAAVCWNTQKSLGYESGASLMFGKRKKPEAIPYDKSGKIPAIRSSICTGEQVAGFKDLASGKFE